MSFLTSVSEGFTLPEPAGEPGIRIIAASDAGGFLDLQVARLTSGFPSQTATTTIAQWVSAEGTETGTAHEIFDGVGTAVQRLQAVEQEGGGWMVLATLTGGPELFPPRLAVQTLAADGLPTGPPLLFTNAKADTFRPLEAATLRLTADPDVFATTGSGGLGDIALWEVAARPDGTLVVVSPSSQDGVHQIIVQVYDAAGVAIGPRQSHSLERAASNITVTTADSGDILVTWDDPVAGSELAILSVEGTLTHHPTSNAVGGTQIIHMVDESEIAFVWQDYFPYPRIDGGSLTISMQIGSLTDLPAPIPLTSYALEYATSVSYGFEPLGNGLYALILNHIRDPLTSLSSSRAFVFDADGWRYGSTTLFTESEASGYARPETTALVDGNLMIWADTGIGGDGPHLFKTFELPDEVSGTAGNDRLLLSSASFVRAGAGDDYVQGSAQNDILDGGAGNDTLFGGTGDDVLRFGLETGIADGGAGHDLVHLDIFDRMYRESERPEALVYADLFTLDPDGTLHLQYGDADLTFRHVEEFSFNGYTTGYGSIVRSFFSGPDQEYTTIHYEGGALYGTGGGDDRLIGSAYNDRLYLGDGNDQGLGGLGADELNGGAGNDYLHGSDALTDPEADLSDSLYGGLGDDTLIGGYGNDLLYGMEGDDLLIGGFGADFLAGQGGDDVITGGAFSDQIFGNDGADFINGGFGHDRLNGGLGGDRFFHAGVEGHGSDWVQDYNAAQGDVLLFGDATAARDDFQVNFADTEGAGLADQAEAFVIYKPSGQIIWALVDGEGQDEINLKIGGDVFDLLS